MIAGAGNNVHNIYIESLYKMGIVGVLMYIVTLFNSINFKNGKKQKKKFVNYFPIIFLAIRNSPYNIL